MELLGSSKRERQFSQLILEAVKSFEGLSTKEAVEANAPMAITMRRAEREAIDVILSGLTSQMPDLNAIDNPKDKRAAFDEIFDVAKRAIFRVLDISEVKSGKASWFAYASKGIDEPPSPRAQLSPSWQKHFGIDEEDEKTLTNVPIWLRERG